jgi:hypothetical protein
MDWEIALVNVGLMLPAAFFWSSLMLRLGLGTDYFFDLVFEEMGKSVMGNIILNVMVIFLPAAAIGINGLMYINKGASMARWAIALGVVFLAGGFYAAVKKI